MRGKLRTERGGTKVLVGSFAVRCRKIITSCVLQAAQRADCRTQLRARSFLSRSAGNSYYWAWKWTHVRARSGWEKFPGTAIASVYTN